MDRSFWISLIPVIAAMVGFSGLLLTTAITQWRQQRQFREEQAVRQLQFDRQANEALFADVMNRFSSDKPILRANAAIRLANIAKKHWPGMPDDLVPENYPFFSDAVSQLTVALRMEESRAVSEEVIQALKRMSEFARMADQKLLYVQIEYLVRANRSAKRAFLDALARFVAVSTDPEEQEVQPVDANPEAEAEEQEVQPVDANPEAEAEEQEVQPIDASPEAEAEEQEVQPVDASPEAETEEQEVQAGDVNPKAEVFLKRLAVVAPLCLEGWVSPSSKTRISLTDTVLCLGDLMSSAEFQDAIALDRQLRIAGKEHSDEQSEEALLQEVQISASRLIDTRTALVDSLLALNSPPGLPTDVAALKNWKRDPALNLSGCFLSGADLKGVHLEGADLSGILLHSAVLYGARLASAQLESAQLERVRLYDVDLKAACLKNALLRRASLEHSRLNGSSCDWADLQDANCDDANFEGASLRGAHLQGATFIGANLTGTRLCDAIFEDQDTGTDHRANFGPYVQKGFLFEDLYVKALDPEKRQTGWWHADFSRFDPHVKDAFAGDPIMEFAAAVAFQGPSVDARAIEWLQANYPTSDENHQALMQRYQSKPESTGDGAPSATAPEAQTPSTDSNT